MIFDNDFLYEVGFPDFAEKPKNGFLLGKFMPPHNGHVFLCDFAQRYCENLTILVCSLPNEPIPGKLRYEWMKELFPKCNVRWCNWELPQEPKGEHDLQFWKDWKNTIRAFTDIQAIDVVFASEHYGIRLAKELNAEFIPCDIKRVSQKCSGTEIRNNPAKFWNFIPNVVKPYFVKRVTLFGPESSGKSTLAAALAEYYNTIVVPEYGRTYTETFGSDVSEDDIKKIVQGHLASVEAAKSLSGPILLEDTDPVMSGVWEKILTGKKGDWTQNFNNYPDLYILCDIDIPWEDDGTRYFPKDEDRRKFFNICKKELDDRKAKYIVVSGNRQQRLSQSVEAINLL